MTEGRRGVLLNMYTQRFWCPSTINRMCIGTLCTVQYKDRLLPSTSHINVSNHAFNFLWFFWPEWVFLMGFCRMWGGAVNRKVHYSALTRTTSYQLHCNHLGVFWCHLVHRSAYFLPQKGIFTVTESWHFNERYTNQAEILDPPAACDVYAV